MKKEAIINKFGKSLFAECNRKNGVLVSNITSTLKTAALNKSFVNESCKSSGKISKSQVIYRKLNENSFENIRECFQNQTIKFLKFLRIFSRNKKFIISFDETEEDYYGEFNKGKDNLYIHHSEDFKTNYCYKTNS